MEKLKSQSLLVATGCMFVINVLFPCFSFAQHLEIYTEEAKSAHYTGDDGEPAGYVVELVKEIQKRIGNSDPITFVPWKRGYWKAMSKPNVLLFSTTFTEERRPLFKWIGPVAESVWALMARADSKVILDNLEDAKKVERIGTYLGDVRHEYLIKNGFTNLDSVSDNKLNLEKLLMGRVDLWATSESSARKICVEKGIDFSELKTAFALNRYGLFMTFNKDTSDGIVTAWRNAFEEIKKEGVMEKIYQKYDATVPTYRIPPEGDQDQP